MESHMLGFVLWPLWRQLKGPLKSLLSDKFSLVGGQLKGLLSSTIDDLIAAIQKSFFDTDTWRHLAEGEIRKKKGGQRLIRVKAFPLAAILEASKIRSALAARLKENIRLDAVRTEAGVADADWGRVVESYAGDVLRFALPIAIKKMIRHEMAFYLEHHVIDVAELEPIRISGKAGLHRLVILYDKPYSEDSPTVAKATKIWKARMSGSYDYSMDDYDGFKAA
jgi:hypothetical protein